MELAKNLIINENPPILVHNWPKWQAHGMIEQKLWNFNQRLFFGQFHFFLLSL